MRDPGPDPSSTLWGAQLRARGGAVLTLITGRGGLGARPTMAPRTLPWALALLGAALAFALAPARAQERPEQLCGLRFVRAVVRLCGGPRWAPEDWNRQPPAVGDRESRVGVGVRDPGSLGTQGAPPPDCPPSLPQCALWGCARR